MPPANKPLVFALLIFGLVVLATAVLNSGFAPYQFFVGLALCFVAVNLLSKTNRTAATLRTLLGKNVRVQVRGAPLTNTEGQVFEVHSVQAFGAGLLVWLLPTDGGSRKLLKIAQPMSIAFDDSQATVHFAGYVQWAGRIIKSSGGQRRGPGDVLFITE